MYRTADLEEGQRVLAEPVSQPLLQIEVIAHGSCHSKLQGESIGRRVQHLRQRLELLQIGEGQIFWTSELSACVHTWEVP